MKERPILFSGRLVRAILDGTKTQTRRPIKRRHGNSCFRSDCDNLGIERAIEEFPEHLVCPYGLPGDHLWVRETFHYGWSEDDEFYNDINGNSRSISRWVRGDVDPSEDTVWYAADGEPPDDSPYDQWAPEKTPSIHMPRWASRIALGVVGIRAERLQDISDLDVKAEGIDIAGKTIDRTSLTRARGHDDFGPRWDEIYKPPYRWADNPWVWVVEFKHLQPTTKDPTR